MKYKMVGLEVGEEDARFDPFVAGTPWIRFDGGPESYPNVPVSRRAHGPDNPNVIPSLWPYMGWAFLWT